MLYPGAFIPFAEESSLILEVDRFVLRESMRRATEWNEHLRGRLPVRVSVNVSPRFLRQLEAVDEIETLLETTQARAEWIQIEITERVTIGGDERTIQTLRALQGLGISIAIDDFGTGYSSLAYLRDLPVDVLKLDQSFVAGIETQSQFAIVEAVITMGHALGVRVTAEGVEFADQLHELRTLGCDSVQGFHFSAAVPADIASTMIEGLASARLAQLADAGVETEAAG
jgi:EAL domain-containing protein (putative c-di-GMP-specific phosphodiesterase class I)